MERTIVGIDVGTTKVCTVVGEATDNELKIVGVNERLYRRAELSVDGIGSLAQQFYARRVGRLNCAR